MTRNSAPLPRLLCRALFLTLAVASSLAAEQNSSGSPGELVILDTTSYWRCHFTYLPEIVRQASGELSAVQEKTIKWARQEIKTKVFSSQPPPSDWASPDFDDSFWVRRQGPFSGRVTGYPAEPSIPTPPLRLVLLRGKFEVHDPAKLKRLTLSLAYAGGVVARLNGREVARGHMPAGDIAFDSLAQDYPEEVYVDDQGALLPIQGPHSKERPEYQDRYRRRVRHLENVSISPTHLRKGINVLTVELHMPPVSHIWYGGKRRGGQSYTWPMVALNKLTLSAEPSDAVIPNASRPNKIQVWNANVSLAVYDGEYGDPNELLRPITMVGARNGSFSGQVVVSSPGPIQDLKVLASALTQTNGRAQIPSSQVSIRYALPDGFPYANRRSGLRDRRARRRRFDGLEESVPEYISTEREAGSVTQPIWITVDVPRNATPGDYEGTVTLWVNDSKSFAVPLNLHVADYVLPCPKDFLSFVGLVQSPETVSLKYAVPLWSRRHWELVEKSFQLLGQVGTNSLFIPLIAGTHLGNEHGMVRWIRNKDGTHSYDYALFEKYLDLAIKHLDKNLVVCFYVWDPSGAYSHPRECIPLQVTLIDPDTGALEEMPAPAWDSPRSASFWQPVFAGLRERLAARGLLKAMAVGVAGQGNPESAIPVLNAIVPEARWVMAQHGYVSHIGGKPVAEAAVVFNWPGNMNLVPSQRFYGWKDPRVINYFPRRFPISVNDSSPGPLYRLLVEMLQTCGFDGVSRIGADFWYLETTYRGRTRRERIIKNNWQQLSLASQGAGQLLAVGKDGPIVPEGEATSSSDIPRKPCSGMPPMPPSVPGYSTTWRQRLPASWGWNG